MVERDAKLGFCARDLAAGKLEAREWFPRGVDFGASAFACRLATSNLVRRIFGGRERTLERV